MILFGIEGTLLNKVDQRHYRKILYATIGNFCILLIWIIYNATKWSKYNDLDESGGNKIKRLVVISTIVELFLLLIIAFAFWKYVLENKLSTLKTGVSNEYQKKEKDKDAFRRRGKPGIDDNDDNIDQGRGGRINYFDERSIDGKVNLRRDEEERDY